MRSFMLNSSKKLEAMDITERVASKLDKEGSACIVHTPHTTAAVTVNESEPNLKQDLESFFSELAPEKDYKHDDIDNNAKAHLTASIIGNSVVIPMERSNLALGTWQKVIFVELDGPRQRNVYVTVIG